VFWCQALFFTAVVTPFEVGFLPEYSGAVNFGFNRLVDLVFIADIIFTFFIPFRQPARKGGMWVYDNRKIARNYLGSWLPLDLMTSFPLDLIFFVARQLRSDDGLSGDSDTSVLRVLRVFRVMKLARILRASRIIKRWEDHISLSFSVMALIKFLSVTLVLAHWLACVWGFVGGATSHIAGNLTTASQLEFHPDDWSRSNWLYKAGMWSKDPYQLYGVSIYVALNNIFGASLPPIHHISCTAHPPPQVRARHSNTAGRHAPLP
jgi:hypothetical protein